jgi:hypothetical protein
MVISSQENEYLFSNEAQRLVYRQLRRRTKRQLRNTTSVADSSLVHSSTLIPLHFSEHLTIVKITHFSATYIFVNYCTYLHNDDAIWPWHIFTAVCQIANLTILPPVQILVVSTAVLTMTTTHNMALGTIVLNAPHFLLCPGESQRTHLSTVNAHNARPIDSAHFA